MASISSIRGAVQNTLTSNISGLRAYNTVPEVTNLPAVVVQPVTADFTLTNARGTDQHEYDLFVLVSAADVRRAQDQLDAFVTGAGNSSIRQVIYSNPTLGLPDDTDAMVSGMRGYGGQFEAAAINHVGAILRLVVFTPGAA